MLGNETKGLQAMTEYNLFYYPYASFTTAQLPLLKVAALYFDKLYLRDPVGASWAASGADYHARESVKQLQDAGILQTVTPADVLAKYGRGPSAPLHFSHLISTLLSEVTTVKVSSMEPS